MLEEMFELIADLNRTLPIFQSDMTLYSDREELQWPLQDIYEDYLSFCTTAVRYLRRRPHRKTTKPFPTMLIVSREHDRIHLDFISSADFATNTG